MGSLTFLNARGDTTITWTEDNDSEMEDIIRKKMAEGVSFFIVISRAGGLLPPTRERLDEPSKAMRHRALSIPDEDLAKFVSDGKGTVGNAPRDLHQVVVKKIEDPKKASSGQSVVVNQRKGG